MSPLGGEERRLLHRVLLSAYPSFSKLERFLRLSLGRSLLDIAGPNETLAQVVFELIVHAEAEGWTEELIVQAADYGPKDVVLQTWATQIRGEVPPPQSPRTQPGPSEPASVPNFITAPGSGARIPPYLGRVLDHAGEAVGTCFQLAGGIVLTAAQVLTDIAAVGEVVGVDPLVGGATREATVLRVDPIADLTALSIDRPLDAAVGQIRATDTMVLNTEVVVSGVMRPSDPHHGYRFMELTGAWGGATERAGVPLARMHANALVPGMSGAPVRRLEDDAVVGVVSGRYNSVDGWRRDTVWVARTESLDDLLSGLGACPGSSMIRKEDVAERQAGPYRLFFSYSHQDERLRTQLESHLSTLRREGVIQEWHDRKIVAGDKWAQSIQENLDEADVVVLLVSADFLRSDYCYTIEMARAVERHRLGRARVLPVIVRACDWTSTPIGKLQALPTGGRPVVDWTNRDRAWLDVVRGIRSAVDELNQDRA